MDVNLQWISWQCVSVLAVPLHIQPLAASKEMTSNTKANLAIRYFSNIQVYSFRNLFCCFTITRPQCSLFQIYIVIVHFELSFPILYDVPSLYFTFRQMANNNYFPSFASKSVIHNSLHSKEKKSYVEWEKKINQNLPTTFLTMPFKRKPYLE